MVVLIPDSHMSRVKDWFQILLFLYTSKCSVTWQVSGVLVYPYPIFACSLSNPDSSLRELLSAAFVVYSGPQWQLSLLFWPNGGQKI